MTIFLTIAVSICFGHFINADLLRTSLFPKNIPPYITFVRDSSSIQEIPIVLKQYLQWKTGHSEDSLVVHDLVQRSGNLRLQIRNKYCVERCLCVVVKMNNCHFPSRFYYIKKTNELDWVLVPQSMLGYTAKEA